MSAKPNMSAPTASATRAASAHPLRAISFGDPAVTVERHDNGTIYLRPKAQLGDYPVRITDRLHHWAGTSPIAFSWRSATPAAVGGRSPTRNCWFEPSHRLGAARARPFGREADRHSLRQFGRSCAARVWRALCGDSRLPGIAGLFAGVARLRQARLSDQAADARSRLRRRRDKFAGALAANVSRAPKSSPAAARSPAAM